MAIFGPQPSGAFSGGQRADTYIVDPETLSLVTISDAGGRADVLRIFDRPGQTAGEFAVEGDLLVWRPFSGFGAVEIALTGGASPIEFLEWEGRPEDGAPYVHRLRILTDPDSITGSNFAAAGTQGNDVMQAAQFARHRAGWSDMYGNDGNDRMTASNRHAVYLYGGDGNDTLNGAGRFNDFFLGDAGNDTLRGNRGHDDLFGGADDDRLFGGAGNDSLRGDLGNDLLNGGTGDDDFIYRVDDGNLGTDRIAGFEIGSDRVLLDGYAAGAGILQLQEVSGGTEVRLIETDTRIVFEGLSIATIQVNAAAIFEILS